MGLDMFLYKDSYIGAMWEHRGVKGEINITINGEPVPIDLKRVSTIREQVAYWRKANAIHDWFVKVIQGGVDECQESDVDIDQLKDLLDLCKKVYESRHAPDAIEVAMSNLPTRGGFFFGSTDYDEWYWADIKKTIEQLERILQEPLLGHSYYVYHASW